MSTPALDVLIRPLRESELGEAARIVRLAFGTFLGLPNPETLWLDRDHVTRYRAAPDNVFAADLNGALAGTNFLSRWGSFAFFGPLTIKPELWDRGIAKKLLAPTVERFDSWGITHSGLFTFAHSAKHVALYQKFGFWPRFLTAIMNKLVPSQPAAPFTRFSALNESAQAAALGACREITGSILDGLDVSIEISSVQSQSLGDTLLIDGDAFAVCHCGPGTEAGNSCCYVKFAAVRSGSQAEKNFGRLLAACESFAAERGLEQVEAGVNLARGEAYRAMMRAGFRTAMQGVAMQRPDGPGFNRPDVFVIDDWR